jgi:hypothetical protein
VPPFSLFSRKGLDFLNKMAVSKILVGVELRRAMSEKAGATFTMRTRNSLCMFCFRQGTGRIALPSHLPPRSCCNQDVWVGNHAIGCAPLDASSFQVRGSCYLSYAPHSGICYHPTVPTPNTYLMINL